MSDHGFDAAVVAGAKSQYDVVADGKLVYSKQAERRWPNDGEVLALLNAR